MAKMFDLDDSATAEIFERIDPATLKNGSYVPSHESTRNDVAIEILDGCEPTQEREPVKTLLIDIDDLLTIEHWKPAEPQFCKEIAAHYQQGKRTIQKWFVDLREIAYWLDESELRLSDDRYTPLAIELLGDRYFAGSKKKWEKVLSDRFVDRLAAASTPASPEVPLSPTKVLPHNSEPTDQRLSGLSLHFGSSLALPAIPGIVPIGNDTAYLTQTQQKLEQFEALQQQVIAQMQQQYDQAQTLNAQYQEATSLSDQLLLQEFQLRGVQLGYTALQLKQQAFKSTVQAAESGTLAVPGKPQPESAQPQPA